MLKTTEPVVIIPMREIEAMIDAAAKRAVAEALKAIGHGTGEGRRERQPSSRPRVEGAILRLGEVKELVGLSTSSIYRLIKDGRFPAQIKLGKHASGWHDSAIQEWIKHQDQAGRRANSSTA